MDERRRGPAGRDAAGLVGDAAMSALEEIVERLRRGGADPAAPARIAGPPPHPQEHGEDPSPPGAVPSGAAVALVAAVVAALVPAVLRRIDVDELLEEVDVQRVADRVDLDGLVARIDLDTLAERLDLDALLARVDLDALVRRLDIGAVAREAVESVDLGEIVRESTVTLGTDVVDGLRLQTIRADDLLTRWVDLVLRRREPREAALAPRRAAP